MQNYARIDKDVVMEVVTTNQPIETLFHKSIVWVAVPKGVPVAPGMRYSGSDFLASPNTLHAEPTPSLHSIMTTLSHIQAQLTSLEGQAQ